MKQAIVGLFAGGLFAVGLGLAQMTDPRRVIGFLDFTGNWDPTLVFVLAGAVGVYFLIHRVTRGFDRPLVAADFRLPTSNSIDRRLLGGAVLFGIGWGLGGFCPGPALASTASGAMHVFAFLAAMIAGMWGFTRFNNRRTQAPAPAPAAAE